MPTQDATNMPAGWRNTGRNERGYGSPLFSCILLRRPQKAGQTKYGHRARRSSAHELGLGVVKASKNNTTVINTFVTRTMAAAKHAFKYPYP